MKKVKRSNKSTENKINKILETRNRNIRKMGQAPRIPKGTH